MLECTTTRCSPHITLLCAPRRAHVTCFTDKPINFPELAQYQTPKMCSKAQSCAESHRMSPVLMHARPFLHLGGVSMQKQLCGQLVCSKSACDRHATHLQSRPAHKGTHTQKVINSRHVHAYLEPISLKLGPCLRLHAATCAGQDLGHKILWQPHAKVPAVHATLSATF